MRPAPAAVAALIAAATGVATALGAGATAPGDGATAPGAGGGVLDAAVTTARTARTTSPPAYREGPPPGHTGGFGEPTCAECHFGAPVNDGVGVLTVDAPESFEPGASYELGVRLTRPGLAAAGFQLAVRFAEGSRAGKQAGTLTARGPGVAVTADTATGVLYGHQTAAGSPPARADSARWTLRWTAPDTAAVVAIHVAANAANDDASEFGDFVYSVSRPIRAR